MNRVLVLSGNRRETADFVKQLDLPVATRHVTNKDSIPMLPVDAVFVLPSFERRPDRHAVWSKVRHVVRRSHGVEPQHWTQVDAHTWAEPDAPETELDRDPHAVIGDVQRSQLDALRPPEATTVVVEPAAEITPEERDEIAEAVHEIVETPEGDEVQEDVPGADDSSSGDDDELPDWMKS